MPYKDPIVQKEYNHRHYLANKEKVAQRLKQWRKAHSLTEINKRHDERMRHTFPITVY